jgi:type I restriction enzyme S subunit
LAKNKNWEANPNIELASELLKKISQEKQKLIAEKKLKKDKPLPTINESEILFISKIFYELELTIYLS